MAKESMDRREFLGLLGAGSAALGIGIAAPNVLAKTKDGVVIQSEGEYGELLVERLTGGRFPYECDPSVLERMSEKFSIRFTRVRFSRGRSWRSGSQTLRLKIVNFSLIRSSTDGSHS